MTIISHNIGDSSGRAVPVARIVGTYPTGSWADLIVVQEVRSQGHMLALQHELRERGAPDYRFAYSRGLGIGVFATRPIRSPREHTARAGRAGYGAFAVTVSTATGTVDVVGVHLEPVPKSRDRAGFSSPWRLIRALAREITRPTARSRAAIAVHEWIRGWSVNPVIVAGDFNTVPASSAARFMRRHYRDALHGTRHHAAGTYWKIRGPKPRVDFIFLSPQFTRLDARVIRERAGDHYPVIATVSVGGEAKKRPGGCRAPGCA